MPLLSASICFALWLPFPSALAATEQFVADCEALTRNAHRLAGTAEGKEAIAHIEKRLREIGPDSIVVEEFPTAQTAVRRCVIEIHTAPQPPMDADGRRLRAGERIGVHPPLSVVALPLLPLRPNGIIPPVTPPEGITARIVHAGAGKPEDFTSSPRGRIVVLDYNCGRGWLRAFRLGARAVVFTAPQPPMDADERRLQAAKPIGVHPRPSAVALPLHRAWQSLHIDANANLPRFYYQGARADLTEGAPATITSEVVWEAVTARNVFALLRGTDPVVGLRAMLCSHER